MSMHLLSTTAALVPGWVIVLGSNCHVERGFVQGVFCPGFFCLLFGHLVWKPFGAGRVKIKPKKRLQWGRNIIEVC